MKMKLDNMIKNEYLLLIENESKKKIDENKNKNENKNEEKLIVQSEFCCCLKIKVKKFF